MFLHRIHPDPRSREARRDLADPYQMHATLCRAFCEPDKKCTEGEFLWRLEPETGFDGVPQVLVQSRSLPDWSRISCPGWFAEIPDPPIDLNVRLKLDHFQKGQRFKFRIRANPCVTRKGKRLGLLKPMEQEAWISRMGREHAGFSLPELLSFYLSNSPENRTDIRISQQQMLNGRQISGNIVKVFSVLYEGVLTVQEPEKFRMALESGIGHGKVLGLGLLSIAPLS